MIYLIRKQISTAKYQLHIQSQIGIYLRTVLFYFVINFFF
jgi:hypothetical protein